MGTVLGQTSLKYDQAQKGHWKLEIAAAFQDFYVSADVSITQLRSG